MEVQTTSLGRTASLVPPREAVLQRAGLTRGLLQVMRQFHCVQPRGGVVRPACQGFERDGAHRKLIDCPADIPLFHLVLSGWAVVARFDARLREAQRAKSKPSVTD